MTKRQMRALHSRRTLKVSRRVVLAAAGTATTGALTSRAGFLKSDSPSVTGGSSMPSTVSDAHPWRVDLVSDFTAGDTLDTKVWRQGWFAKSPTAISNPVNQDETASYGPNNLSFDSQGLHLKLTNVASGGRPHTAALVSTRGLRSFSPGSWIEARLHLPGTAGRILDWPGFWLNGYDRDGRQWPQHGEIDIVEGLSGGYAAWHYHWGPRPGWASLNAGGDVSGDYTGWHTFAAHWETNRIDFYYDGRLVGSATQNVQSDPHYLVLLHSTSNWGPVGSEIVCSSVRTWTHS